MWRNSKYKQVCKDIKKHGHSQSLDCDVRAWYGFSSARKDYMQWVARNLSADLESRIIVFYPARNPGSKIVHFLNTEKYFIGGRLPE